ncbi:thyrotropin-releasing hormone receptor-like [Rhincodon typus]|uniref:thyrotropin-releasing hormone receptor-like n=1 Tax=Rhincodon typus TaxID=259920 RepID=UPI0020309691|nr:thyrotropin-releasing hormone receptor-like [Rhincodon typus]
MFFLATNLAVVVILSRGSCGLSRCITYYLISMAVTDLLVIITSVILNRIVGIYFPFTMLSITPVCSLSFVIIYGVRDCSVGVTVAFTFDRFVAISCQKLRTKYCAKKTAVLVIGAVCVLGCVRNIPWYFIYEPSFKINNTPYSCSVKLIFYTLPMWAAFDWILAILTPWLPLILIFLLNALTIRNILAANGARRRIRVHSDRENHSDPEIERRRKSIILLFTISGSFILLYLLYFINIIYVRIAKVTYFSGSTSDESAFFLEESGYMLQFLSSCINPFIYTGTQSKFRQNLKDGLKYPLAPIIRLLKYKS